MKSLLAQSAIVLAIATLIFACKPHKGAETPPDRDITVVKPVATDDTNKLTPPDKLITPGKSIGKITIGGSTDTATQVLGKPDSSDAAMGSVLLTWNKRQSGQENKVSIFASHNYGSKDEATTYIRKIWVTSPQYKTTDGLNTGLPLTEYQKHFDLKQNKGYTANGRNISVYESAEKGIAFEIDSATHKGIAIMIHKPGDASATYINMH